MTILLLIAKELIVFQQGLNVRDLSTGVVEKDKEGRTPASKWLLSGVVVIMSEML